MRLAGLSIEASRISVAVARRVMARTPIASTSMLAGFSVPLPQGDEDRAGALSALLVDLAEKHSVTHVVVGLEPALFTHTVVPLPVISHDDIRHALGFEMEKYLPLPPEEYLTDFQTIRATETGSENLVLSLRRDKARWVLSAFREAPVSLLGLRCTAFEVLRDYLGGRRGPDMLFVYQGETSNALITLSGGSPAELSLKTRGANPEEELRAALTRYGRQTITTGVEGALSFKGEFVSSVKTSPAGSLASGAMGRWAFFFEFCPPEMRPPKADYLPAINTGLAIACAVIFTMTSVVGYFKDYSALSSVRERLREIKTTSSEIVEVRRQMEALEKKKRFLDQFHARRNRPIQTLARLSAVLPSDAWVSNFTADEKGTVDIEGYAVRTANLIAPLERSAHFRDVELTTPVTVQEGRERFSMRIQTEP